MNFLDWCLLILVVAYAISGYWQGFVTGAAATIGLLLGGLLGIWLAPILLGNAAPSLWVSLGALFVVLVDSVAGSGDLPVRRVAAARAHDLAAHPRRRRRGWRGPQRGRGAGGGLGAGRRGQRLADPGRQRSRCATPASSWRSTG